MIGFITKYWTVFNWVFFTVLSFGLYVLYQIVFNFIGANVAGVPLTAFTNLQTYLIALLCAGFIIISQIVIFIVYNTIYPNNAEVIR